MRRSNAHNLSFKISATLIIAFLLIFLLTRGFVERGLHIIQKPLVSVGTWIYQQTSFLQNAGQHAHQVKKAEERLAHLAFDRIRLETLEKENAELKEALGFLSRNAYRSVSASIVSRTRPEEASLFVIDKGDRDQVTIGDPVVVNDGVLIGKVVETSSHSATVQSITDPQIATAVGILGQSQTIGVAEGTSGNLLRLKFIPQDTQIQVNDLVVTSGLEARIPSGLFVGLINDVRPEQNAPFLEAFIEPIADVRQFSIVHVLIEEPL